MSLAVTVSASSTDGALSDTASLRQLLGITTDPTGAQEAYHRALLRRASVWATNFVGYPLLLQKYQECVPAYGHRNLMLSRTPLRTILRVFDATDTGTATEYCSTDYRVQDKDAGFLSRDRGFDWTAGVTYGLDAHVVPQSEREPWLVEYQAGYVYPALSTSSVIWSTAGVGGTTSTARTLPEDIEQAVLLKAVELFQAQPGNVQSKQVGDLAITYVNSKFTYRSEAEDLLEPYRRMA